MKQETIYYLIVLFGSIDLALLFAILEVNL
jgi:hypothetical protein